MKTTSELSLTNNQGGGIYVVLALKTAASGPAQSTDYPSQSERFALGRMYIVLYSCKAREIYCLHTVLATDDASASAFQSIPTLHSSLCTLHVAESVRVKVYQVNCSSASSSSNSKMKSTVHTPYMLPDTLSIELDRLCCLAKRSTPS